MPDEKRPRADAQRNLDALVEAAKSVFTESGVTAPVRDIAARAGVGVGTLYRHFPQRSDLVVAVMHHDVDALTTAGRALAGGHDPIEALTQWLLLYSRFVGTKHGLGSALRSGDPAYAGLPEYFEGNAVPELGVLLDEAAAAGEIRDDMTALELVRAVSDVTRTDDSAHTRRMIGLLVDGLRFGARRG